MTIGERLDAGFRLYFAQIATFARIVVPLVLGWQLIVFVATLAVGIQATRVQTGDGVDPGAAVGAIVFVIVAGIGGWVVSTLATAACFGVAADHQGGRPTDWRRSIAAAWPRIGSLLWLTLLTGLLGSLAMLALVVPGIWLLFSWALAIPVLLFEDQRGLGALRRSFRLVRGAWWSIFFTLLVAYLVQAVAGGALGALAGAVSVAAPDSTVLNALAKFIANSVSSIIGLPLIASVIAVAYFDRRRVTDMASGAWLPGPGGGPGHGGPLPGPGGPAYGGPVGPGGPAYGPGGAGYGPQAGGYGQPSGPWPPAGTAPSAPAWPPAGAPAPAPPNAPAQPPAPGGEPGPAGGPPPPPPPPPR